MAPAEESQTATPPRHQTVAETDFLRRTGLDPNDDGDMQLYSLMKVCKLRETKRYQPLISNSAKYWRV